MEGGEDEAVVSRLPEELDVGGVGDAGDGDAVAVLGGSTEGFGHLLLAHAPVRGHEGHPAQEQRHYCLDEGEARGTHLLQERHHSNEDMGWWRNRGDGDRQGDGQEEMDKYSNMGDSAWKSERITSVSIVSKEKQLCPRCPLVRRFDNSDAGEPWVSQNNHIYRLKIPWQEN